MPRVLHVKGNTQQFVPLDGLEGPGEAQIARVVTDAESRSMGAGIVRMTRGRIPWTVRYDEVLYVIDGELKIEHGGQALMGRPGDVFFIEEWTPIAYATDDRAVFFWALYPADWRTSRPAPA